MSYDLKLAPPVPLRRSARIRDKQLKKESPVDNGYSLQPPRRLNVRKALLSSSETSARTPVSTSSTSITVSVDESSSANGSNSVSQSLPLNAPKTAVMISKKKKRKRRASGFVKQVRPIIPSGFDESPLSSVEPSPSSPRKASKPSVEQEFSTLAIDLDGNTNECGRILGNLNISDTSSRLTSGSESGATALKTERLLDMDTIHDIVGLRERRKSVLVDSLLLCPSSEEEQSASEDVLGAAECEDNGPSIKPRRVSLFPVPAVTEPEVKSSLPTVFEKKRRRSALFTHKNGALSEVDGFSTCSSDSSASSSVLGNILSPPPVHNDISTTTNGGSPAKSRKVQVEPRTRRRLAAFNLSHRRRSVRIQKTVAVEEDLNQPELPDESCNQLSLCSSSAFDKENKMFPWYHADEFDGSKALSDIQQLTIVNSPLVQLPYAIERTPWWKREIPEGIDKDVGEVYYQTNYDLTSAVHQKRLPYIHEDSEKMGKKEERFFDFDKHPFENPSRAKTRHRRSMVRRMKGWKNPYSKKEQEKHLKRAMRFFDEGGGEEDDDDGRK